jgi:peptide/nickel transport system ATP-binding protein
MREIGPEPWRDLEAHPEREPRAIAGAAAPLIRAQGVSKTYGRNGRRFAIAGPVVQRSVNALHDVTFDLYPGETLGVVGESGCGKTTLLAALTGLVAPSQGTLLIEGHRLAPRLRQRKRADLQTLQIVFQNPERSLNPRHTVDHILRRAVHTLLPGLTSAEELARVVALLGDVGLSREYLNRFPAQLSGGEKQRVALARALAGDARLILADEVTSALDVSVRASILNLMATLQRERGLAYIFVSHDMSAVHHIADRVMVLYLGMVMELGRVQDVFRPPYHPYAEALLSAIPIPDPKKRSSAIALEGAIPSATQRPAGCPFHTRCPRKKGPECATALPPIHVGPDGHQIRCHWQRDELAAMQERVA